MPRNGAGRGPVNRSHPVKRRSTPGESAANVGFTFFPLRRQLSGEPFSTVTARRFCDQHEMSSQTATGRSLP